jgi:uncharacterized membrane protein
MLKKYFVLVFLLLAVFFISAFKFAVAAEAGEKTFKAKVVEIIGQAEKSREDGSVYIQQDLRLRGLGSGFEGRAIDYKGIGDIEVLGGNVYHLGDEVFVNRALDESGQESYYIIDYSRTKPIYWLTAIFILAVILVGRSKGFKAILSLVLSFVVIMKFILPAIISGYSPFVVSLIGGVLILAFIIYLTEGFNKKSHLAILSVLISLSFALIISYLFVYFSRLTGLSQEESSFLIGLGGVEFDFRGLLLAGFVIGAVGVLDDMIIGQIEAVEQLQEANPDLSNNKIFALAYKVGNAHLGAIINTLFLTYVGASLPLLLLFVLNENNGLTLSQLLSTESITTEIVRTLSGSIGVILSMPIATFLASRHRS